MKNKFIKYISVIVIFVFCTGIAENAFASVKGFDDEHFKFYASFENEEFKAENVVAGEKKWSTVENQKQGDWFVIDMLENHEVGQIILNQDENNYPARYNVYASTKRENLTLPIISNGQGSAGLNLTIDFPEIVKCRFLKIELAEGTEENENPWNINSVTVISSNEASRKAVSFEVSESSKEDRKTTISVLLNKIGIEMDAYDGTKASFAKVLTEFCGMGIIKDENMSFRDVKSTDKSYDYILTMSSICGITDKMFYPEKEITIQEVLRYILDVMGYKLKASVSGGYPNGYKKQAVQLGLIGSKTDCLQKADKTILENILYNALFTPILKQISYGSESTYESSEDWTCGSYWHNLKKAEGLLVSTSLSSITGDALVNENSVMIGEEVYKCNLDAEVLLGSSVTAYIIDERGEEKEIIYISENTNKNSTLTLPAVNIVDYSNYKLQYVKNYPDSNKVEKVSIDKRADMIYNFRAKVPFDESLLGLKNGYVKLIDNDNNGVYDVVSVYEYVNYVVSYKDKHSMIISDHYGKNNICLSESEKYELTDGEVSLDFNDISEGDVVSVFADSISKGRGIPEVNATDAKVFRIIVSKNVMSGEVTGFNEAKNLISIDGKEYYFDHDYKLLMKKNNAIQPKIGGRYVFRTDYEKNICDVRNATESDVSFALILGAVTNGNSLCEVVSLKLLTTDGQLRVYPVYKKVKIDGVKVSEDFSVNKLKALFWDDVTLEKIDNTTGATITYTNYQIVPQVIGYRLNDAGEISYIDTKHHNGDKENSNTSIGYIDVAKYTCNIYRGMIYPTEKNNKPNLNLSGVRPILFVGPVDVSSANINTDYAVYDGNYFEQDGKYEIEVFKKSEFNDLEIAFIHANASDAMERYKYILVEDVVNELTADGDVKKKLTGVKYGARFEAFFESDEVLINSGLTLNKGDLVVAELNPRGEIALISRLVDVKNPNLTLHKNDKYYSGERITIGQVYNSDAKNLMVSGTRRVSDPDVVNELELFMLPETAIVYDEEADEVRIAQVSDVLAYKKTNSEERTSVIYACTSWGLHQSFVIYNFKDYVPDAGI